MVVQPYLEKLTKAEIHSMMVTGLGSIAMSVFGVYIKLGVSHLLTLLLLLLLMMLLLLLLMMLLMMMMLIMILSSTFRNVM